MVHAATGCHIDIMNLYLSEKKAIFRLHSLPLSATLHFCYSYLCANEEFSVKIFGFIYEWAKQKRQKNETVEGFVLAKNTWKRFFIKPEKAAARRIHIQQ